MLSSPQIVARQASDIAMTPDLRRAIGLLKLSNRELAAELEGEARVNAALALRIPAPDLALSLFRPPSRRQPPPAMPGVGGGMAESLGVAGSPGLHEHIMSELRLLLRSTEEMEIAEALALSVSPWGWLDRGTGDIAQELVGRSPASMLFLLGRNRSSLPGFWRATCANACTFRPASGTC